MILCVTLNSCLDKTLEVPTWHPGQHVRGIGVREVVGGKGNNVARVLHALGQGEVRPVTFLGGHVGRRCLELFQQEDGLDPIVVDTEAPTREILTVRSSTPCEPTAFFDPNPAISAAEAERLLSVVRDQLNTGRVRALTLSGSSPAASTHGLFQAMLEAACIHAVPTFLDTYGPALACVRRAWPHYLQLNRTEAAQRLGVENPQDSDLVGLTRDWLHRGAACAVITNGGEAAWVGFDGAIHRLVPPKVTVTNPVGSGDSFLAGMVDGSLRGLDFESRLKFASACGASNAMSWDAGRVEPRALPELMEQARLRPGGD